MEKIANSLNPSRIAAAVSLAITVACAALSSPVARAEHVFGRWLTRVRATSMRICAVPADSRSADDTSSRSASSTPVNGPSDFPSLIPATATIARCIAACNQLLCRSSAAR